MDNINDRASSPLRLLYFGFTDEVTHRAVRPILETFNVTYCEYYYDEPRDLGRKIVGKGHFYIDVQKGDYKVDWNKLAPLDEKLLDALAHCESTVMRMFDRNDIWAPLPYAERKALYLKHVRYWADCLDRNQINLTLFSGIPHGSFDYIVYVLCKLKNIPTLVFSCQSLWMDTSFLTQDIDDPAPDLAVRFKQLCEQVSPEERSRVVLAEWSERQFQKMTDIQSDQTPFYMKNPIWKRPFDREQEGWLQKIRRIAKSPSILLKGVKADYWIGKLRFRREWQEQDNEFRDVVAFYNEQAHPVDMTRRFIYVPLHLQPECTTCPMGGAFVEQQLMVQLLAAAAPPDVLIYVKEHPMQDKYGVVSRSRVFYQDLLDVPNVRLVPRGTSTYALMKNCAAISTATGAAGWEALFRQKPYLMFGHHVYQYAPGVLPVDDLASCRAAIDAVFHNGFFPRIEDLRLFFKAIEETAIRGYAQGNRREASMVSDDENVANLTSALLHKIEDIGFSRNHVNPL